MSSGPSTVGIGPSSTRITGIGPRISRELNDLGTRPLAGSTWEVEVLHVATDAVMKFYRRGILRAGRATPPRVEIAVDRWAHAYPPKSEVTLCGLKVEKLHWRPFRSMDFTAVNAAFHCPRCSKKARSD